MIVNHSRRSLILSGLALAGTSGLTATRATAQSAFVPREGDEYQVLNKAVPTEGGGKIDVLDFFWYGCPHCYHFLPAMEAWRQHKSADVNFHHVPVDFGDPRREPHTRLFYALQALDKVDEIHVRVFDAYNRDRRRLDTEKDIADFMASNGIARDKWLAAYNSFAVASQVMRAHNTLQAYGIDGTPTLAIDGRFLTSPSMLHNQSDPARATIATLDYLIERVRKERKRR
jgi:thiol:disulfide interchange protein DsbA